MPWQVPATAGCLALLKLSVTCLCSVNHTDGPCRYVCCVGPQTIFLQQTLGILLTHVMPPEAGAAAGGVPFDEKDRWGRKFCYSLQDLLISDFLTATMLF